MFLKLRGFEDFGEFNLLDGGLIDARRDFWDFYIQIFKLIAMKN